MSAHLETTSDSLLKTPDPQGWIGVTVLGAGSRQHDHVTQDTIFGFVVTKISCSSVGNYQCIDLRCSQLAIPGLNQVVYNEGAESE